MQASPFVVYAREKKSPQEVAEILGCSVGSARDGLRDARVLLQDYEDRISQSCQILLNSGLSRPEIRRADGYREVSRWGAWQDVALGLKRAA